MYILLDIEWVDKWEKSYLTQIAAIRVNDNWEEQDSFSCLVAPPKPENTKWQHVAFSGYEPADFLTAADEATVLGTFREWLRDDDVICLWHYEAKLLLERLWKKHLGTTCPNQRKLAFHRVFYRLMNYQGEIKGLYCYAQDLGIVPPNKKHMAASDVAVMKDLLSHIYVNWDDFAQEVPKMPVGKKAAPKKSPPKKTPPPKMKPADKPIIKEAKKPPIEECIPVGKPTENRFFFSKESKVFHKKGCPRITQTKEILGASCYDLAYTTRRPCKICNPLPTDGPIFDNVTRLAKFFNGHTVWAKNKNVLGYCHYHGHPGDISKGLLLQHGCIEKKCFYLQKYPECSFWKAIDAPDGMELLEEMQKTENPSRWLNDYLDALSEEFETYLADAEHPVKIIRIEKKKSKKFKAIYASDAPADDNGRLQQGLARIQAAYPQWYIEFRRAKNIDGTFLSVSDFNHTKTASI